jgi:glycosidase
MGRRTRRVRSWSDVTDWNYASRGVRDHLLGAVAHWVESCDIDGYRCDVAGMVPADFWLEVRERLLRLKPDHLLLAEWDDPALHRTAFHASYDWELYRHMVRTKGGRSRASVMPDLLERRHAAFPSGAQPLRFVENHDEPRVVRRFGSAASAVSAFTALAGGLFLVHNGQEVGAAHRPDLFHRDPIVWDGPDAGVRREWLRRLLALRAELQPLGPPRALRAGESPDIAAYQREGRNRKLVVSLNLSGQFQPITGPLAERVRDAKAVWPNDRNSAAGRLLPPRSACAWLIG